MRRIVIPTFLTIATLTTASAGPLALHPETSAAPAPQYAAAQGPNFGGGFLEMLFGGPARQAAPRYEYDPQPMYGRTPEPAYAEPGYEYEAVPGQPSRTSIDPRFMKQEVVYDGREQPGTIIINTRERLLYLVQGQGRALRYGIGVGRPGFTWAGVHHVSNKREWPDWTPPAEMLKRRPDLPRHMEGGPDNPLGARAMYLGSTLYRIHGSNEPWTIGHAVSSGCIRLRNEDVIDLYSRVKVGAKVIVL
jgi:lipoprotein-anchoring transpeptidase ErfK/SrfK